MLSPRDHFGIRETNTNVVKKPSAVDDRMNDHTEESRRSLSRENSKKQLDSFSSLANGSRSDQNLQESEFIRKAMTTYYIWPLNNVVTYKLILQNYECPVCYVYIDLVDIKSKTVFPVMVTYALISPELLPRDIYCSYKALWTLKGNDDVASKNYLSNE